MIRLKKTFDVGDIVYLPCTVESVYVKDKVGGEPKYYELAVHTMDCHLKIEPLIRGECLVEANDFKKP